MTYPNNLRAWQQARGAPCVVLGVAEMLVGQTGPRRRDVRGSPSAKRASPLGGKMTCTLQG